MSAAVRATTEGPAEPELLPDLLTRAAEAATGLVRQGLVGRGLQGDEARQLSRAFEAALLVNFSPAEVATLRRLLARVEASAQRLAAR